MPFSFPLLVEFFFPGLILFCAGCLAIDILIPAEIALAGAMLTTKDNLVVAVFVIGLVCYYLGTAINAVSNTVIRLRMADYRRAIIRRKLGLESEQSIDDLSDADRRLIQEHLPRLKSTNTGDRLNEFYAAARTFCSLQSDRTAKTIDYHWSLMRLARAALLPLGLLALVLLVRSIIHHSTANTAGFVLATVILAITFQAYRYREKFLIYTVFDTFFESAVVK